MALRWFHGALLRLLVAQSRVNHLFTKVTLYCRSSCLLVSLQLITINYLSLEFGELKYFTPVRAYFVGSAKIYMLTVVVNILPYPSNTHSPKRL